MNFMMLASGWGALLFGDFVWWKKNIFLMINLVFSAISLVYLVMNYEL